MQRWLKAIRASRTRRWRSGWINTVRVRSTSVISSGRALQDGRSTVEERGRSEAAQRHVQDPSEALVSYRKVEHGRKITRWLCDHDQKYLERRSAFLAENLSLHHLLTPVRVKRF